MKTLILTPAYMDYATESAAKYAWETGQDFIIHTIGVRGTYASIRDMPLIRENFDQVTIRYNHVMEFVIVYPNTETVAP